MVYENKELFAKTFSLGEENDFSLHHILLKDEKYIEIKTMFILYNNTMVTKNYTSTLEFFSILEALIKKNLMTGDENRFFSFRQQKIERDTIRSLQFKYDKQVYISTFQAMSMCQIFYESKTGLSTKSALETDTEIVLPYGKFPDHDSFVTSDFNVTEHDRHSFSFTAQRMSKADEYIYNTANMVLMLKALKKEFSEN